MSATTGIQWTDRTWNPIRGCSPVSPGCAHCYAARQARRMSGPGGAYEGLVTSTGKWTGSVSFVASKLLEPITWSKPRRVFVNSMSDLCHSGVSLEVLVKIWAVMRATPRHTYQILTKRPESLAMTRSKQFAGLLELESERLAERMQWCHADGDGSFPLSNVHEITSCENQAWAAKRIPWILGSSAIVIGVSLEPLLGPIDLTHIDAESAGHPTMSCVDALTGGQSDMGRPCPDVPSLQWVIVGCESGPGRRPCELDWIRDIVRQCRSAGVPCFVKQVSLGGKVSSKPWQWPLELRVRMFPGERWN